MSFNRQIDLHNLFFAAQCRELNIHYYLRKIFSATEKQRCREPANKSGSKTDALYIILPATRRYNTYCACLILLLYFSIYWTVLFFQFRCSHSHCICIFFVWLAMKKKKKKKAKTADSFWYLPVAVVAAVVSCAASLLRYFACYWTIRSVVAVVNDGRIE